MNEESVKTSNELVRWLKMLALPGWARLALALIMLLIARGAPAFPVRDFLNAGAPHGR